MAAYRYTDAGISDYVEKRLLSEGWRIAVWVAAPIAWLMWIELPPLSTALFPISPLAAATGLAPGCRRNCLASLSFSVYFGGAWTGIPAGHVSAVVLIGGTLSTAGIAISEEFLFRGVFLSGLLARRWSYLPRTLLQRYFFLSATGPDGFMAAVFPQRA